MQETTRDSRSKQERADFRFLGKEPQGLASNGFQYFVTREDDLQNEGLYSSWVSKAVNRSLRFKKFNVYSDIEIPRDISQKVLKEVLARRVEFNHKYFSGIKGSMDLLISRIESVDIFESTTLRVSPEADGLNLHLYVKSKPTQETAVGLEADHNSILLTTSLIKRGAFNRLDTTRLQLDANIFDLSIEKARAQVNFPWVIGRVSVRPFAQFASRPVFSTTQLGSLGQTSCGFEFENRLTKDQLSTLSLELLHKKLSVTAHPEEMNNLGREAREVDQLARRAIAEDRADDFGGVSLSYTYMEDRVFKKINGNDLKTRLKARAGLLCGNDFAIELGFNHSVEKKVKGYLTGIPMVIRHQLDLDTSRSLWREGLLVNSIFEPNHRILRLFGSKTSDRQVQPTNLRVRNHLRLDTEGIAGIGAEKNIHPFLFAAHSLYFDRPSNPQQRVPNVCFAWSLGLGLSWAASHKLSVNLKCGLASVNQKVQPAVSVDFCSL